MPTPARRRRAPARKKVVRPAPSRTLAALRETPSAGRLALRLKAEREAGMRFLVEAAPGADLKEARAEIRRLLGAKARVEVHRKGGKKRSSWLIATLPDRSTTDSEVNAFDVAHQLREESSDAIVRVEPDWPQEPRVEDSCPSKGRLCFDKPNGPADKHWHLREMRVDSAWTSSRGTGISIGHVDTGYSDHPEMKGAYDVPRGRDFVDDDPDARDPLGQKGNPGHGTKTGSVLASRHPGPLPPPGAPGPTDLAGVAPDATIVPIRSIRRVIIFFNGDVARGIDHAANHGCHVVSMSLGGVAGRFLQDEVDEAVKANLIVCAAAGNCVKNVVEPASFWNCIAVAGTKPGGSPWDGSSHGPEVEVSAPGYQVWVAAWCKATKAFAVVPGQGTSFSVAAVAGVAALWLAHHGRPSLLATYGGKVELQFVFMKLLVETASGPSLESQGYGSGVVDARALLDAELPPPEDVVAFRDARRARFALAAKEASAALRLGPRESAIRGAAGHLLPPTAKSHAEADLLDLELRQILHDHPSARMALVNGLRWRAAGAAPTTAHDMPDEMNAIAQHASERLKRHLR